MARKAWLSRSLRVEPLERRCMLTLGLAASDLLADVEVGGDQTTLTQTRSPAAAVSSAGDSVFVWTSDGQDGADGGVFAQRFDASGVAQGECIPVNQTWLSQQVMPSVAMDAEGDFVVTWSSLLQDGSLYGVYARCYSAAGEPQTDEFRVNQATASSQNFSSVAIDADGDFVVAWTSQYQDGDKAGVFARRYSPDGTPKGDEFQVNTTTTNNQRYPVAAMDPLGNFVVTWTSQDQDGSGGGVYAQRYYVDGSPLGGEFQVNTTTTSNQQLACVSTDLSGTVFAWQSYDSTFSGWNVFVRRFDANGQPASDEVLVAKGRGATVTKSPAGDYIVAWETYDPSGKDPSEVRIQHYDSLDLMDGEVIGISSTVQGDQFGLSAAGNGEKMALLWTHDTKTQQGLDVKAILLNVTPTLGRNHAPVVDPIDDATIAEMETLSFTASAHDPDDPPDGFTFSLAPGSPAGATIDPTTGFFSWTPSESQGPGAYVVTVRATDDNDVPLIGATTFVVTVTEENAAPTINPIEDQTLDEQTTLTLTVTATDPDLPPDVLTFSLGPGAPEGVAVNAASGVLTWTPTESQGPGEYTITVTATDDGQPGLSATTSFTVTANEVNRPPVINAIAHQIVDVGQTLELTATATDPDLPANTLTFSLVDSPPTGATIDPATGQFAWTPTAEQGPGEYSITVQVGDGGGLTSQTTFTVTVEAAILEAIANQTMDEETLLSIQLVGTPPYDLTSGVTLTLDAGAPPGMAIDPATATLTWTPTESQGPGLFTATVRAVIDGEPNLFDTETFTISVAEVNRPPELDSVPDQTIDELTQLQLTAIAVDPDLPVNTLTFRIESGPEGAEIDPTTGVFRWTPREDQNSPTPYVVTLVVEDNGNPALSDAVTFSITVNEVNQAPRLDPIDDQTIDRGQLFHLTVTATDDDIPANSLSFSLDGAPPGATIDPTTGEIVWQTAADETMGQRTFTVRATDDGDPPLSDVKTFTVTVEAPLIEAIADVVVDEGQPVSVAVLASSPYTLSELTLSLDTTLPEGATFDPTTGALVWTTDEAKGPGVYRVTIRAVLTSDTSLIDTETFTITVNEVNQPPVLEPGEVADLSIAAGETVSLAFTAADPDMPANTLTFALAAGAPAGATIDPQTGAFSWATPANQLPGSYPITVRVVDNAATPLSDEVSFTIHVSSPNGPPAIDPVEDQTVNEGETLSLTVTAADTDDPPDAISFRLDESAPVGATIDPATGFFTWTPDEQAGPGTYAITVWVADDGSPSLEVSMTFHVTVIDVNGPPALTPIEDQVVEQGGVVSVTVEVLQPEGGPQDVTLSLDTAPAGATFNPATGEFRWEITEDVELGVYEVVVRATDNQQSDLTTTEAFSITVVAVNQPPKFEMVFSRTAIEGYPVAFDVPAGDVESPAGSLTFWLEEDAPAGAAIDPTTGRFTWTPTEEQGGQTYSILVHVRDQGPVVKEATVTLSLRVYKWNDPPQLAPLADQTLAIGETLLVTAVGSDTDLPVVPLVYSLGSGAPSGVSIHSATGQITWTPEAAQEPGQYTITVRVTDGGWPILSATRSFVVTLTAPIEEGSPLADASPEPPEYAPMSLAPRQAAAASAAPDKAARHDQALAEWEVGPRRPAPSSQPVRRPNPTSLAALLPSQTTRSSARNLRKPNAMLFWDGLRWV